tara:strand:+ start:399 stop:707 length:309 start_codon:yes stop_codon:yes gene_type:complete
MDIHGSHVSDKIHLHLNSKTSIAVNKSIVQHEMDTITIDYYNTFYYIDLNGNLQKNIYKGINSLNLNTLKELLLNLSESNVATAMKLLEDLIKTTKILYYEL